MSLVSESAELTRPLPGELSHAEPSMAGVGDYLALLKPRVMSLVVFTALVGIVVAPDHLHPVLGFFALVCIAVGGSSLTRAAASSRASGKPSRRAQMSAIAGAFSLVCAK